MAMILGRVNSLEPLRHESREVIGNMRRRRSAATIPQPAQYINSGQRKLRLKGDQAFYLEAQPGSDTISVGPHRVNDPEVCFRFHLFAISAAASGSEGGQVVVLEAHDGGRYVTHEPAVSPSVSLTAAASPQQTTSTDSRFFRLFKQPGDLFSKLRHLHTGMYLSASQSGVTMESAASGLTDSMNFEVFPCSHS